VDRRSLLVLVDRDRGVCQGRSPDSTRKSSGYLIKNMVQERTEQMFALCIENRDCEDLEKRKIYQILPDGEAAKEGYLRVVDESGEDYLYPRSYFILIRLPPKAQDALLMAR